MPTLEAADLLIEARWLLPIAPANTVLTAHGVVVTGGRIVAVGPAADLRARFAPREHVVRERHALLPGLVNAHTRACHTLLRGVGESASAASALIVNADFVRDGTRVAIAEMLRAGVTCFADLSFSPEEVARVSAALQMRAVIGLPVADAPTPWAESATAHLGKAERLWDEYRADPRIQWYFAPLAAQSLSDATLMRVRRVTDELDARLALDLTGDPGLWAGSAGRAPADGGIEDAPRRAPIAMLGRLADLGLLRPGFTALGTASLGAFDLELIARHGASLVACPQADLRRGEPPQPLPLLEDDRTGLGTDSPPAAGAFDLLAEARVGALFSALDGGSALRLATLGGATALGLAAHIGSIEPGKAADLICIELDTLACRPAAGVQDAIVFAATRGEVTDVWSAGRAALSGGRLLAFDEEELAALIGRWAERLGMEAAA